MMLNGKATFRAATVQGRRGDVGFDEKQNLERRDGQVGVAFLAEIGAAGGGAQDLDDETTGRSRKCSVAAFGSQTTKASGSWKRVWSGNSMQTLVSPLKGWQGLPRSWP